MSSIADDVIAQKIEQSISRVSKVVFPTTTNHHSTLFGGTALAWMDEVSFITATRFSRKTPCHRFNRKNQLYPSNSFGNHCRTRWLSHSSW